MRQGDRPALFESVRRTDLAQIYFTDVGAVAVFQTGDCRESGIDALMEIALADAGEFEFEHLVGDFNAG